MRDYASRTTMIAQFLNILKERVGEPPEWSGDPETEPDETRRWMQWSVRKREYEGLLEMLKAEERAAKEAKESPSTSTVAVGVRRRGRR